MQHVAIDDVDDWIGPSAVKRPLARALGAENVAINYYELDTGDQFGFGYHRHPDQEEVFYVLAGTATFETEDGDVAVEAGEALRFAPGEWQLGRNDGDQRVEALALGAPADASDAEIRRECDDCGERTPASIERAEDGDGLVTVCEDCGAVTGRYE
ncbi:cupin domain-containing protein [Halobacteriales archaeon Cl-PHB]